MSTTPALAVDNTSLDRPGPPDYVATTNACKLCMPLGAALAFKGVEGAVPFLHGSQGCATYMRRYIISHFREPIDIASSALGEAQAVFGGGPNLKKGLINVINKYRPRVVGVATTCLTETIGDDVPGILGEFLKEASIEGGEMPALVSASTPAYAGTQAEGFQAAVKGIVSGLATGETPSHGGINLLPGMVSPADLRHLKAICRGFGLKATILPDYSRTLDAPASASYEVLPAGGTPVEEIAAMGGAAASLECGRTLVKQTAGAWLEDTHDVPLRRLGLPIGLRETDALMEALEELSGRALPEDQADERGRLLDAMVDGHKYVAQRTAVVYGDADLAAGITAFLAEIGIHPVLVATGGRPGNLEAMVDDLTQGLMPRTPLVWEGVDFFQLGEKLRELKPDLILGGSKGYRLARELETPLIRVGFPIHDRFGAQRVLHLGYTGALSLYDRIVNAVLAHRQAESPVGWGYL